MRDLGRDSNERYLLTGATGFLGSHIMAGLLSLGKHVIVAGRPSGDTSLKQRIGGLLAWFGIEDRDGLLDIVETDFLRPRIGLADSEYEQVSSPSGLRIIHCASDTRFSENNRMTVLKSNVESLHEILNFSIDAEADCFHYISSAYAAGLDNIHCLEELVNSLHFTNIYEESKAHAERIIAERCRQSGMPYSITRPSIVYGNSVTGRSLKFNALYYPVKSLQHIRDIYLADLKNNNGKKSSEYGIRIVRDGTLYLPIRIFIPHEGSINLIPVDYFTETFLAILSLPVTDTVYHITGNEAETMVTLAAYAQRFLHITGIEVIVGVSDSNEMRNPPEELFDHFIQAYRPYISDRRTFVRTNTDKATGNAQPPELSYDIFQRCMEYATSVEWGKKL